MVAVPAANILCILVIETSSGPLKSIERRAGSPVPGDAVSAMFTIHLPTRLSFRPAADLRRLIVHVGGRRRKARLRLDLLGGRQTRKRRPGNRSGVSEELPYAWKL